MIRPRRNEPSGHTHPGTLDVSIAHARPGPWRVILSLRAFGDVPEGHRIAVDLATDDVVDVVNALTVAAMQASEWNDEYPNAITVGDGSGL